MSTTPDPNTGSKSPSAMPPAVTFTDKEKHLFQVAVMKCLKSGPPEIDYKKFMKYGEFNTMKTATNTWGKMRAKLVAAAAALGDDGDAEGEEGAGMFFLPCAPSFF